MKTKTKLCFFVVALCCAQLISCKKNASKTTPVNSAESIEDAGCNGLLTDSSLNMRLVAWYTAMSVLDHSGRYQNNVIFNSAKATAGKSEEKELLMCLMSTSSYMQVANSKSINPLKITLYALVKPKGFYQGTCHYNRIL